MLWKCPRDQSDTVRVASRSPLRLLLTLMLIGLTACASTRKSPPAPPPPTSATAGTTTIVAIAPPAGAGCDTSLPKLLGLPQIASGVGGILQRLGSRLLNTLDLTGRFPELQPQPPLLALSDPANMEETAPPAVQAAAEIKAEEDAAPQKIMAIRYLATLGCGGCYDKVEQALLEGMSDCTEEVRFEAVKALECRPDCGCKFCTSPSCCSPPVRKRLEELTTCEKEQSARVRRAARLALACCNGKPLEEDDVPREGPPGPTPAPAPGGGVASILEPNAAAPASVVPAAATLAVGSFAGAGAVTTAQYSETEKSLGERFKDITLVAGREPIDATKIDATKIETSQAQRSAALTTSNSGGADHAAPPANDRLLARVNKRAIYESQLGPLVDARLRHLPPGSGTGALRPQVLYEELLRLIDWYLVEDAAARELLVSNSGDGSQSRLARNLGPNEVHAWLERKLAIDPVVESAELLAYYQIHQEEHRTPARVRWETITVLASKCGSKEQAAVIAAFLKARSEGRGVQQPREFTRSMVSNQVHDWLELSKVESAATRDLLARLQPGQVSQVVRDGDNLLLIRLLQRENSQVLPLAVVAEKMTEQILAQRRHAATERFLSQARAGARIWTAWDGSPAVSAHQP